MADAEDMTSLLSIKSVHTSADTISSEFYASKETPKNLIIVYAQSL